MTLMMWRFKSVIGHFNKLWRYGLTREKRNGPWQDDWTMTRRLVRDNSLLHVRLYINNLPYPKTLGPWQEGWLATNYYYTSGLIWGIYHTREMLTRDNRVGLWQAITTRQAFNEHFIMHKGISSKQRATKIRQMLKQIRSVHLIYRNFGLISRKYVELK